MKNISEVFVNQLSKFKAVSIFLDPLLEACPALLSKTDEEKIMEQVIVDVLMVDDQTELTLSES